MDQLEIKASKHNRIRMFILKILATEYPKAIDSFILRRCLSNFGYPVDVKDLDSYLAYLEERGYVKIDPKPQYEITMISVTADGIDILDRRIVDQGVGLE